MKKVDNLRARPYDFLVSNCVYGKCTKITDSFLFLFLNNMLANREDPDQTSSAFFGRQLVFEILEHLAMYHLKLFVV